ncbi:hypothetical protein [Rhodococcus sp. ZPP]|nr:hypothetical protein [Rhodococcus sp. ZPP]
MAQQATTATSGWVSSIGLNDLIDEGFEAHDGKKMKVLVDPTR